MNDKQLEQARVLKKQLAAFSDYLENGIDWVKKYYSDQYDFVMKNKDKSYDEINSQIEQQLAAITER